MPPKKEPKKKQVKQRQKQTQKQSLNVIVNIPEKKATKRKKRTSQTKVNVVDYKAFPPQIIYPSVPLTMYSQAPQPEAMGIMSKPPAPRTILEDIGTIGTEGRVEILDRPTRRESLEELISPVSLKEDKPPVPLAEQIVPPATSMTEGLKKKTKEQTIEEKEAELNMLEAQLFSLTGIPLKKKISKTQLKKMIAEVKRGLYAEGFPKPPRAKKQKKPKLEIVNEEILGPTPTIYGK
jgi:hypothetical protein